MNNHRKDLWISSIDGLRAFSILAVLIHHFNPFAFRGWGLGNLGVAVFFSISGMLAYLILDKEFKATQKIDYNAYITRRILRIWPLYFLIVFSTFAFDLWANGDWDALLYQYAPLFLFSSNLEIGRFGASPPAELSPLWSIAVEEHFYLLAPVFYFIIKSSYRWIFVGFVFFAANALRLWFISAENSSAGNGGLYYMSFTYLDTFVSGCLVGYVISNQNLEGKDSLIFSKRSQAWALFFGCLGLLVIGRLWGLSVFPPYKVYAWVPYVLMPLAMFIFLFAVTINPMHGAYRFLSWYPLRIIGVLSYSMYVVHLFVFFQISKLTGKSSDVDPLYHSLLENVLAVSLVIVIACILHILVERPFLALKKKVAAPESASGQLRAPWAALLTLSTVIAGISLVISRG